MSKMEFNNNLYEFEGKLYRLCASQEKDTEPQFANTDNEVVSENTLIDVNQTPVIKLEIQVPCVQKDVEDTFIWSKQNTLLFLEEYKLLKDEFRNPKKRKKDLWELIASKMALKGYHVDSTVLDRKLRNMKDTYKKCVDNKNKTGRGPRKWEYFDLFEELFLNDNTRNIPKTVSAMKEISADKQNTDENNSSESLPTTSLPISSDGRPKPLSEIPEKVEKTKQFKGRIRRLEEFRKKSLDIELQKLEEVKRIRIELTESNAIQKEKLKLLREALDLKRQNPVD